MGKIEDVPWVFIAVLQCLVGGLAPEVFADGDVFHFLGYNPLFGVPHLGDGVAVGRAQWEAAQSGIFFEAVFGGFFFVVTRCVFVGEVAVVFGLHIAAAVFFDVAAAEDPISAQGWEAFFDIAFEVGISPRAGSVVDADWFILFDPSIRVIGG